MKKYVQVGMGFRGTWCYAKPLVENYSKYGKLCGVCDPNTKRASVINDVTGKNIPVYDDFDKMIKDIKPDTVIVTPKDCVHDEYVIRAMKAGCNVIVEKPITTTFEKALNIKKTQDETGKDVIVTFNLRFHPFFKRVKEVVADGTIGDILSVHYEWMLDTRHGADYFRRWHRQRENSGSLLVHKSTHHFDLINWFLEDEPVAVNAYGTRRFYGPTREERGERCLTCKYADKCEYCYNEYDYDDIKRIYFDCEDVDGYYRDRCIFSEEIDIEDSVSINVQYKKDTVMSYSLTAHSPYEGFSLCLNGTKGRIEVRDMGISGTNYELKSRRSFKIFNRKGEVIDIQIPETTTAGHGGADDELRDRLFKNEVYPDPLGQMADTRAGLMSIGIGMAANLSMKENRRVYLSEFYDKL